jgi:Rrf2 family protein
MRVTKWGEYGILCSLYLARSGDRTTVGAADVARAQVIPLQYTQQILQRLRKGNVIKSVRGPHGGYRLARAAADISLKDILYAAEGSTFEVVCEESPVQSTCGLEGCGLSQIWYELRERIDELLAARSLADLVALDAAAKSSRLVPPPRGGVGAGGAGRSKL